MADNVEKWMARLEEVKEYMDKHGKRPNKKNKDTKTLGSWVTTQNMNYKKKTELMKKEGMYDMWTDFMNNPKYKPYFISKNNVWKDKLDELKIYIDKYNKLPSESNKDTKTLRMWTSTQNKNYKNKTMIMKKEEIYNIWTDFINDPKYKPYFISNEDEWKDKLNELKIYIDKYNKLPSQKNKDTKILGGWVSNQNKNYKNKINIMKNQEVYNTWTDFINNPKYKSYLISNDDAWKDKLDELKIYIDKYNKLPLHSNKDTKILGLWISTQNHNYKNNKDCMNNKEIYDIWSNFIDDPKYKPYFISKENAWKDKIDALKIYINKYNKLPSRKNKDTKILGAWLSKQNKNYKNKTQIMKKEEIYDIWTEFINDNAYKKFFKYSDI